MDEALVRDLARDAGLSPVTARVLVGRGVTSADAAERFFTPSLSRDWRDPETVPGMPAAADAVAEAVRAEERVVVFGDFDVDGISAAAVATLGLRAMGAEALALVPHRFREGYGLSEAAMERALSLRPGLVVTVDCGISSAREVEVLRAAGARVVVTDHHEPGDLLPEGVPVADPKLPGYPFTGLAGAGVALKLVQAVGARLGFPDVWRTLTDLATLGTVADIVPLVDENRALVAEGLALARSGRRVALAALAAASGIEIGTLSAEDIAFRLAPRLNAAGRMADPAAALELLLAEDPERAETLALALDGHNRVRQAAEQDLFDAALAEATARFTAGDRLLVLAGEGWHEGVKGIVASRLAKRFGVPAVLFAVEDGVAKGSGRSVGRVDLFAAVSSCADMLERFGGHEAAVGLTLPAADLPALEERLHAHVAALPDGHFVGGMVVDAEVRLEDISEELTVELGRLEPFGNTNPRPLLATGGVFMNGRKRVGKDAVHLRFEAYDGVTSVSAIAFRLRGVDSLAVREAAVDLAYEVSCDEWRGAKRLQLTVREVHAHPEGAEGPAAELVEDLFARADELLARGEYAGIGEAEAFHTKLAGVTFEGRQDVAARLAPGTPLRLERQPDNDYDANACALFAPDGLQAGFFNRRLAAVLAPLLDSGLELDVEVSEVTGGEDGKALGVNVLVSRRGADTSAVEPSAERRAELAALPPAELDAALARAFIGDRDLHDAQRTALAHLAEGRSCLTVMATGRGKSLIFHLHAARLAIAGQRASVFVYPLRALVADQSFHLTEAFASIGLTCALLTGESALGERDRLFAALAAGALDVVLTTPEFLDRHAARFAEGGRVAFVVVDEAHHVGLARAGHRPAYARLGQAIEALGGPTVLAVTATAPADVASAVTEALGTRELVLDPTVRENLRVVDRRDCADKAAYLASVGARGGKLIVYVNSREATVQLARSLREKSPALRHRVAFYNGGLSRPARHAVERAFREGELSVVVATSAFGEGVSVPDVRDVALYHLPMNGVEFNQMCGRGGRDGAPASVHLLFGKRDARINELILESLAPCRDDLAQLYLVLSELRKKAGGEAFEVTNAELADEAGKRRKGCLLTDRSVSTALGIFRELGFIEGEGSGSYRRLRVLPEAERADLGESVRYREGLEEQATFMGFKEWALTAAAPEVLAAFDRPILPADAGRAAS